MDLHGVQPERVWLEFDPTHLVRFGVDLDRIFTSLQTQNIVLPGGTINAAGQDIVVEPSGDHL